jgi:hypothetical protein
LTSTRKFTPQICGISKPLIKTTCWNIIPCILKIEVPELGGCFVRRCIHVQIACRGLRLFFCFQVVPKTLLCFFFFFGSTKFNSWLNFGWRFPLKVSSFGSCRYFIFQGQVGV